MDAPSTPHEMPPGPPETPATARPSPAPTRWWVELTCLALLLLPWSLLVDRFWFVCDDAFISFRYALNLAEGQGLRFNLGEGEPVEGYSNLLWVLVCALVHWLGGNIVVWAPRLSAVCAALLILALYRALVRLGVGRVERVLATASMAWLPPFALWSTSGLETMAFMLLLFLCFDRLILREKGISVLQAAPVALALTLSRPEALGWVLVLAVFAALSRRARGQASRRPLFAVLGVVLAGYAVWLAWRWSYYGKPLANTAYAKSGSSAEFFERGYHYVAQYWLTFLTPFLLLPAGLLALRRGWCSVAIPATAVALGIHVYGVVVSGDFMAMGRFLVPALPLQAIVVGLALRRLADGGALRRGVGLGVAAAVFVTGLLPGFDRHILPERVREQYSVRLRSGNFRSEYEFWDSMRQGTEDRTVLARTIKRMVPEDSSLVCTAIGALGFYTRFTIYDQHGLVTPGLPSRGVSGLPGHDIRVGPDHFLDHEPTIVHASLIESGRPAVEVLTRVERWKHFRLRRLYVGDFRVIDAPDDGPLRVVCIVRRLTPDEKPELAWQRFERRVEARLRGTSN